MPDVRGLIRRPSRLFVHALIAPVAVTALAGAALGITPILTSGTPSPPTRAESSTTATTDAEVPPLVVAMPAQLPDRTVRGSDGSLGTLADYQQQADEIPVAAIAAYQRAAAVLASAAPRCNLDWSVLAAIGRIATDHGTSGGSRLDDKGISRPAVLGPALDGRQGRPKVKDTDAGRLDGRKRYDAAVGSMRLLPATWTLVAVDGDSDGQRNPQDVDDAALAAAVLLCGTERNLDRKQSFDQAVQQFHTAKGYPDLVRSVARYYVEHPGDPVVVPDPPTDLPTPILPTPPPDQQAPPSPTPSVPGGGTATASASLQPADPESGSTFPVPDRPSRPPVPEPSEPDPPTCPTVVPPVDDPPDDTSADPTDGSTDDSTVDPTVDPSEDATTEPTTEDPAPPTCTPDPVTR